MSRKTPGGSCAAARVLHQRRSLPRGSRMARDGCAGARMRPAAAAQAGAPTPRLLFPSVGRLKRPGLKIQRFMPARTGVPALRRRNSISCGLDRYSAHSFVDHFCGPLSPGRSWFHRRLRRPESLRRISRIVGSTLLAANPARFILDAPERWPAASVTATLGAYEPIRLLGTEMEKL